jgi:hypothetical protein
MEALEAAESRQWKGSLAPWPLDGVLARLMLNGYPVLGNELVHGHLPPNRPTLEALFAAESRVGIVVDR